MLAESHRRQIAPGGTRLDPRAALGGQGPRCGSGPQGRLEVACPSRRPPGGARPAAEPSSAAPAASARATSEPRGPERSASAASLRGVAAPLEFLSVRVPACSVFLG